MDQYTENATLLERLQYYAETEQHQKAKALCAVGDHLEECFQWELSFDGVLPFGDFRF